MVTINTESALTPRSLRDTRRMNMFVSVAAAVAGLLFGLDIGVIAGALPFITGTLMTTLLALVFCIPFSLPVALFVGEYFKDTMAASVLSTVTDLLAGIPSIIYGLWGFYTLRPLIMALNISPQGSGILTASLVLAIMNLVVLK